MKVAIARSEPLAHSALSRCSRSAGHRGRRGLGRASMPRARISQRDSAARSMIRSEELLQQEKIDFAFAFGRHSEMPRIAEAADRTPDSVCAGKALRRQHGPGHAAAGTGRSRQRLRRGAVHLPDQRFSRVQRGCREADSVGLQLHVQFRFIVGPPSRYDAAGAGWVLDPAIRWRWLHDQRRDAFHRPLPALDGQGSHRRSRRS